MPRPSGARRPAKRGRNPQMKMTRFGATGNNVLASARKVGLAKIGERRVQEDETISTRSYKAGQRVTAAKQPMRPKGAPKKAATPTAAKTKVSVTNPAGKTISVSSRSALARGGGFVGKAAKAAAKPAKIMPRGQARKAK